MSDSVHLLIPFASSSHPGCEQPRQALNLPHLERLLARLTPVRTDMGEVTSLSTPHERALAREYGLDGPDGCIPWAAWQVQQSGRDPGNDAWAWVTPCHWQVASDHIVMGHPQQLGLDGADSQALLAAMKPYFEQDGITLEYHAPTLWLARSEVFRGLATASLDRVQGRPLDDWMLRTPQTAPLRRLQQEMQMLLYTHAVHDERVRGGQLPVNSFWISGTGALPEPRPSAPPAGLQVTHYLHDAAVLDDWPAWTAAWQQVDGLDCARLCAALAQGQSVSLTLCGERAAQTWSNAPGGLLRRLTAVFGGRRAAGVLAAL